MKMVVPVKQVPEITEVRIDPVTHTLVREGVPSILNPFDEFAVEEALRIREKHGGDVTVLTMGPPQAKDALLKCLAMGADRAILLTDRAFAGADTWATAYALYLAIKQLEFDIVLCGKQAIDGDTAQVGPMLAESLGIPQITFVKKVEINENARKVVAHRETEDGYEIIECRLPVLLTAIKGLNEPRLPSLMGMMNARKKEIKTVTAADLGVRLEEVGLKGSYTEVVQVFTPEPRQKGTVITEADPEKAVDRIVEFLLKQAII